MASWATQPAAPPAPSRTIVYVDGFNVYYAIKATGFKWLDLVALSARLLPNNQIDLVRYFTARVSALPHDPQAPSRQQTYFRALATLGDSRGTLPFPCGCDAARKTAEEGREDCACHQNRGEGFRRQPCHHVAGRWLSGSVRRSGRNQQRFRLRAANSHGSPNPPQACRGIQSARHESEEQAEQNA